jgi:peptide chain release factor subunit 3
VKGKKGGPRTYNTGANEDDEEDEVDEDSNYINMKEMKRAQ